MLVEGVHFRRRGGDAAELRDLGHIGPRGQPVRPGRHGRRVPVAARGGARRAARAARRRRRSTRSTRGMEALAGPHRHHGGGRRRRPARPALVASPSRPSGACRPGPRRCCARGARPAPPAGGDGARSAASAAGLLLLDDPLLARRRARGARALRRRPPAPRAAPGDRAARSAALGAAAMLDCSDGLVLDASAHRARPRGRRRGGRPRPRCPWPPGWPGSRRRPGSRPTCSPPPAGRTTSWWPRCRPGCRSRRAWWWWGCSRPAPGRACCAPGPRSRWPVPAGSTGAAIGRRRQERRGGPREGGRACADAPSLALVLIALAPVAGRPGRRGGTRAGVRLRREPDPQARGPTGSCAGADVLDAQLLLRYVGVYAHHPAGRATTAPGPRLAVRRRFQRLHGLQGRTAGVRPAAPGRRLRRAALIRARLVGRRAPAAAKRRARPVRAAAPVERRHAGAAPDAPAHPRPGRGAPPARAGRPPARCAGDPDRRVRAG